MNILHTVTITDAQRASIGYEAIFMSKKMFIVLHDLGDAEDISLEEDITAVVEDLKRVIAGVCKSIVFCRDRDGSFKQLTCDEERLELHALGTASTFKEAKNYWSSNKAQ